VSGLVESGVLRSGGGKVQLHRPADLSADWNPEKDTRISIWEVLHQLIRALRSDGESAAGQLLSQPNVESRAEASRQLAYRLYTLCERKGWAEDARAYNELVTSWSAVESNASREPALKQGELF
jgi:putative DNA methylase